MWLCFTPRAGFAGRGRREHLRDEQLGLDGEEDLKGGCKKDLE